MIRIKKGSTGNKKHKKIIKLNKGFKGSHSKLFRTANQQNQKALVYSYNGRKNKKREMKKIWIKRINTTKMQNDMKYSSFKNYLKHKKILLNKKILAKIIELDPLILRHLTK